MAEKTKAVTLFPPAKQKARVLLPCFLCYKKKKKKKKKALQWGQAIGQKESKGNRGCSSGLK